ncbi:hypothetical protein [Brevundimonas sp. RM1]
MTADLSALIARLEAAEVGSRELDAEIGQSLGVAMCGDKDGAWGAWDAHWTSSMDAALAIVERVLPGWRWSVQQLDPNYEASLTIPNGAFLLSSDTEVYAISKTPALALVIAILRAKQGEGE